MSLSLFFYLFPNLSLLPTFYIRVCILWHKKQDEGSACVNKYDLHWSYICKVESRNKFTQIFQDMALSSKQMTRGFPFLRNMKILFCTVASAAVSLACSSKLAELACFFFLPSTFAYKIAIDQLLHLCRELSGKRASWWPCRGKFKTMQRRARNVVVVDSFLF